MTSTETAITIGEDLADKIDLIAKARGTDPSDVIHDLLGRGVRTPNPIPVYARDSSKYGNPDPITISENAPGTALKVGDGIAFMAEEESRLLLRGVVTEIVEDEDGPAWAAITINEATADSADQSALWRTTKPARESGPAYKGGEILSLTLRGITIPRIASPSDPVIANSAVDRGSGDEIVHGVHIRCGPARLDCGMMTIDFPQAQAVDEDGKLDVRSLVKEVDPQNLPGEDLCPVCFTTVSDAAVENPMLEGGQSEPIDPDLIRDLLAEVGLGMIQASPGELPPGKSPRACLELSWPEMGEEALTEVLALSPHHNEEESTGQAPCLSTVEGAVREYKDWMERASRNYLAIHGYTAWIGRFGDELVRSSAWVDYRVQEKAAEEAAEIEKDHQEVIDEITEELSKKGLEQMFLAYLDKLA